MGQTTWYLSRIRQILFCTLLLGMASAAENPRIAFLGVWDRSMPLLDRSGTEKGLQIAFVTADQILNESRDVLDGTQLLFVLNLNTNHARLLAPRLTAIRAKNPHLRIIALDKREAQMELEKANLLERDPKIVAYWIANGAENTLRMLAYIKATYLGLPTQIEPPISIPEYGYYLPECADALASMKEVREKAAWKENAPTAAIIIQQSFWITHDTKVTDAEIAALRKEGFNVVTIFGDRGERVSEMLREVKPDLIVEDRHGTMWNDSGPRTVLEELDAPYLRPISMLGATLEEWQNDPRGLTPRDQAMFMSLQESKGTIEPVVVGGLKASIAGYKLHEPIEERVERFAQRAAAWVRLRRKPNSEKRVAIIYYNKMLGKDDLMRGSPTGAFLDGPESLMRFLPKMKEKGYRIDNLPRDGAQLIDRIRESGRNIAPWAQGELNTMARQPDAVLVPAEKYAEWFNTRLPQTQREDMIRRYGPPPGRLSVAELDGKKFILLPAVQVGNVWLMAQPERGECMDTALLHSRDVPPPHNYLAFYWWLQTEWKADALIHWGTHGSLELLPGKENGLSKDDWSDICVGTLPVIDLWIMDNIGESTIARRRSYALLVDHLVPPPERAEVDNELKLLAEDIQKYEGLEAGLLKEQYRIRITQQTACAHLLDGLKLTLPQDGKLTDEQIDAVDEHLDELYHEHAPMSLHILGQAPAPERMVSWLVSILHQPFLDRVAEAFAIPSTNPHHAALAQEKAEGVITASVLGNAPPPPMLEKDVTFGREMAGRLRAVDGEITNLLRALEGRYIKPGPGPDPIRNPGSVPSGRNLYALNPEEIPTKAAWEVGKILVDEMLKKRLPKKVGVDLSGMTTMQDYGVMEAQVLYLMGVRPIWDANNLAIDVELISAEELKRPRIDVFMAMGGHYKENFTSRVTLLDKAVRLVSALQEKDNHVREGTETVRQHLLTKGLSAAQAESLAPARIFGTKPGNLSGTKILYLVPRSGVWENPDELVDIYIDNMSYVYTGDVWGERVDGLYDEAIQNTDTLVRVWASNMTSQLSNHHAYEYLGGLSMAVKKLTGHEPQAFIADVRDPDRARMRNFEEVLDSNFRTELLNKKWIEGMKAHGYAGAGHVAELVKNTMGWSVTRESSVGESTWKDIYDTYVQDKYNLGTREWFEKSNPHAMQELSATLMESARKGYWHPSAEVQAQLASMYAQSVALHGDSNGMVSGGNTKLSAFVQAHCASPELAAKYAEVVARAAGQAPASAATNVSEPSATAPAKSSAASPTTNVSAPPSPPPANTPPPNQPAVKSSSQPNSARVSGRKLEPMATPSEGAQPLWIFAGSIFLILMLYGFVRRKGAI